VFAPGNPFQSSVESKAERERKYKTETKVRYSKKERERERKSEYESKTETLHYHFSNGNVMFAGKHGAYLSEVVFRFSPLGLVFWPYPQTLDTRLEKLAKDKYSSLLRKFVNYGQKSSLTLSPGPVL
jgi:hypothetical protein